MMRLGGTISRLRGARLWLGHALLVAFVLKALIPAGFMPAFAGADGGSLKIVICTAGGSKLIDVDGDEGPHGGSLAKHASEPCTMSGLAALTAPVTDATVALPVAVGATLRPLARAVTLPPARAGPACGSRAPPSLA